MRKGYGIPLEIVNIPKINKESASKIIKDGIDRIGISRKIDIQCCYDILVYVTTYFNQTFSCGII